MTHHHPTRLLKRPQALAALIALGALGAPAVQAQVIDELALRREGKDAVMTIRMTVQVQFRRSVASGGDDLVQIYYDVVTSREQPSFIDGERRQLQTGALPRVVVTEDGTARELTNRKLVVRVDKGVRMRARAGRDNRSFDVVLEGQGEALSSAPTALIEPAPVIGTPSDAEVTNRAGQLIGQARDSLTRGEPDLAIEQLNEALNLPPNARTPEAQEAIAGARLAKGDRAGAQREAELYLQLYPSGTGAPRMRGLLAELGGGSAPAPTVAQAEPADGTRRATPGQLTGSWSQYFYGGASQTQTQLKDTPLEGQLPKIISDTTLSGTDQKQLSSSIDLNWRQRDTERDLRAAFRDNQTYEMMPGRPSRNRLTAAYVDWKETGPGLQARVGRQSGLGGGVLGRFDGIQGSWTFKPKWKIGAVAGQPTDDLLDTRRYFGGLSLDAEALTENLGASVYVMQQQIDGEVDRRALGLDMRWFEGATSVFSQYEYDLTLRGTNVASLQGTTTLSGGTTLNMLADYRAVPLLMLGNALFFADPNRALPRRLSDLLAYRTMAELRQSVASTTAYSKQGLLGVTQPVTEQWQVGADIRLTSVGAIAPVPSINFPGSAASGNIWSGSLQLIGTNLYSERDTHVASLTLFKQPGHNGWQLSYNNMSAPTPRLQLEPSLRIYGDNGTGGVKTLRWSPGMRLAWRGGEKWVIEGEVSAESSKTTSPTLNDNSTRVFYYLGYRLDL